MQTANSSEKDDLTQTDRVVLYHNNNKNDLKSNGNFESGDAARKYKIKGENEINTAGVHKQESPQKTGPQTF